MEALDILITALWECGAFGTDCNNKDSFLKKIKGARLEILPNGFCFKKGVGTGYVFVMITEREKTKTLTSAICFGNHYRYYSQIHLKKQAAFRATYEKILEVIAD